MSCVRDEYTTNVAKMTLRLAQIKPPVRPPIRAALKRTLVFGMYMYRNVNTPVTNR
jgi:hypothetical protein